MLILNDLNYLKVIIPTISNIILHFHRNKLDLLPQSLIISLAKVTFFAVKRLAMGEILEYSGGY